LNAEGLKHYFSFVDVEDPILDTIQESPPFTLPWIPKEDHELKFVWLPEKLVIFDVEFYQEEGLTPWTVSLAAMERGCIKEVHSYYLQEAQDLMASRGIHPQRLTPSDVVRKVLLKYQTRGYVLCAKGNASEMQFMLGRKSGPLKPFMKQGYMEADWSLILGTAAKIPFSIFDLQMGKIEKLREYYLRFLPVNMIHKISKDKVITGINGSHLPVMECLVFLIHWKIFQDYVLLFAHWLSWEKYYLLGLEKDRSRLVYHYWDERIQYFQGKPIESISPVFEKYCWTHVARAAEQAVGLLATYDKKRNEIPWKTQQAYLEALMSLPKAYSFYRSQCQTILGNEKVSVQLFKKDCQQIVLCQEEKKVLRKEDFIAAKKSGRCSCGSEIMMLGDLVTLRNLYHTAEINQIYDSFEKNVAASTIYVIDYYLAQDSISLEGEQVIGPKDGGMGGFNPYGNGQQASLPVANRRGMKVLYLKKLMKMAQDLHFVLDFETHQYKSYWEVSITTPAKVWIGKGFTEEDAREVACQKAFLECETILAAGLRKR
jgi:hypothetical protein